MTRRDDSHILVAAHSTSFIGPDATRLYHATVLKGTLELYEKFAILPNRRVTLSGLLALTSSITGRDYGRGAKGRQSAISDLHDWIHTMKTALPIIQEGKDDANHSG